MLRALRRERCEGRGRWAPRGGTEVRAVGAEGPEAGEMRAVGVLRRER